MINNKLHNFHIPVMGLAYTIDSPLRVAHFGIDSVVSIVDDELIEKMHAFYSKKFSLPYTEITQKMQDYRAKRITAYLNTLDTLVKNKFEAFCNELAESKNSLDNFMQMLPSTSEIKKGFQEIVSGGLDMADSLKNFISEHLQSGSIDVNIMTKVDKTNFNKNMPLPAIYNDAHAALRGFANSRLNSSLVLSAGMNPSLFSYIAEFSDFLPDAKRQLNKKIILKVSDFRSAMIQGSFLAKKGVWVSEYRIESGLNCGGHAFATDGLLLGPIMEEFKNRKKELVTSTFQLVQKALQQKDIVLHEPPQVKITVQGGVGTAEEHEFLLEHYEADSVGWGSPFLLVPEATATDPATRKLLAEAKENDFYRSNISPLGVPFNTVKGTTNEKLKNQRIDNNMAGSSCPKKLLALSREFDEKGICTASRKYQQLKLHELEKLQDNLCIEEYESRVEDITVKSCLCVGLANPAYLENNIVIKGEAQGVVVCPGPNMAYFDKEVSLKDMVCHIYGYKSVLAATYRPNMFIKELVLYIDYLIKDIEAAAGFCTSAQVKKWNLFKKNLLEGISYYKNVFSISGFFTQSKIEILEQFQYLYEKVSFLHIPCQEEILA
ncbi:hypothetical protein R1T16_18050 [Flavobacterium sp. DG1-102-2]|uniref:hypothetical protein n=1 Tax=Flavobacterium sp. DG1-102-2 TaxID=3081663 RepID=UPI00294958B9|nr:hypothetical protein [Flavobacterium sp. DG1-102-2]MDV6170343.1 hypothetical protein [Flavobacterium sp. DG1-102-2]